MRVLLADVPRARRGLAALVPSGRPPAPGVHRRRARTRRAGLAGRTRARDATAGRRRDRDARPSACSTARTGWDAAAGRRPRRRHDRRRRSLTLAPTTGVERHRRDRLPDLLAWSCNDCTWWLGGPVRTPAARAVRRRVRRRGCTPPGPRRVAAGDVLVVVAAAHGCGTVRDPRRAHRHTCRRGASTPDAVGVAIAGGGCVVVSTDAAGSPTSTAAASSAGRRHLPAGRSGIAAARRTGTADRGPSGFCLPGRGCFDWRRPGRGVDRARRAHGSASRRPATYLQRRPRLGAPRLPLAPGPARRRPARRVPTLSRRRSPPPTAQPGGPSSRTPPTGSRPGRASLDVAAARRRRGAGPISASPDRRRPRTPGAAPGPAGPAAPHGPRRPCRRSTRRTRGRATSPSASSGSSTPGSSRSTTRSIAVAALLDADALPDDALGWLAGADRPRLRGGDAGGTPAQRCSPPLPTCTAAAAPRRACSTRCASRSASAPSSRSSAPTRPWGAVGRRRLGGVRLFGRSTARVRLGTSTPRPRRGWSPAATRTSTPSAPAPTASGCISPRRRCRPPRRHRPGRAASCAARSPPTSRRPSPSLGHPGFVTGLAGSGVDTRLSPPAPAVVGRIGRGASRRRRGRGRARGLALVGRQTVATIVNPRHHGGNAMAVTAPCARPPAPAAPPPAPAAPYPPHAGPHPHLPERPDKPCGCGCADGADGCGAIPELAPAALLPRPAAQRARPAARAGLPPRQGPAAQPAAARLGDRVRARRRGRPAAQAARTSATTDPTVAEVIVMPGAALDCRGDEIVVRHPRPVYVDRLLGEHELERLAEEPATVYLTLCFHETPIDPMRPLLAGGMRADPRLRARPDPRVLPDLRDASSRPTAGRRASRAAARAATPAWSSPRSPTSEPGEPLRDGAARPRRAAGAGAARAHRDRRDQLGARRHLHAATTPTRCSTTGLELWFSRGVRVATLTTGRRRADRASSPVPGARRRRTTSRASSSACPHDELHRPLHLRAAPPARRCSTATGCSITVRGDFILDECCRALDADHLGGGVPFARGPGRIGPPAGCPSRSARPGRRATASRAASSCPGST